MSHRHELTRGKTVRWHCFMAAKIPSGDEELSVATKRSEVRLKQTPTVWWVFVCHVILLFDFLVLNLRLTPLAVLLEVNLALDELAILT